MQPTFRFVTTLHSSASLLLYIVNHLRHPSTIIIGSSRDELISTLVDELLHSNATSEHATPLETVAIEEGGAESVRYDTASLLASQLLHQAIARHIRVFFTPTVSHLRAQLSVLPRHTASSAHKVLLPPEDAELFRAPRNSNEPDLASLVIFGLVDLHRDSSEWSAQGLMASLANAVDAGERLSLSIVLVEPKKPISQDPELENSPVEAQPLLGEPVPVLGPTAMTTRGPLGVTGISPTTSLQQILSRWFDITIDVR